MKVFWVQMATNFGKNGKLCTFLALAFSEWAWSQWRDAFNFGN